MQNKDERIRGQIERLRKLEAGWLDGIGVAFDRDGLDWLCGAVCGMADDYGVRLYPVEDGQVNAEWTIGSWHPSIDIDIVAKTGWFHGYNIDTKVVERADPDLSKPESWVRLTEKLRGYAESQSAEGV